MRRSSLPLAAVLALGLPGALACANGPDLAPSPDATETGVFVARRAVWAMVPLREPERLFIRKACPPDAVPPDAIRSLAELKDERLNTHMPAGQVVRKADLLRPEQAGGGPLPPKRSSCSVRVPRDPFVCGQLRPGMRVDVDASIETADGRTTRRVLTDVLVVRIDPAPAEGKPAEGPHADAQGPEAGGGESIGHRGLTGQHHLQTHFVAETDALCFRRGDWGSRTGC